MNKKKGFTLIELLAVIVILAIIALIATPIVLDIINDVKISSVKSSMNNIEKALELYYYTNRSNNEIVFNCEDGVCKTQDGDKLNVSGQLPSKGLITISKSGRITYDTVILSGYMCDKINNEFTCSLASKNIESSENNSIIIDNNTSTTLNNYRIYGNSIQNNVPNLISPIEISSVGYKSKNLFNVNTITEEYSLLIDSGELYKNSAFNVSDFIKIDKTFTLSWVSNSEFFQVALCFYDNDKKFISGQNIKEWVKKKTIEVVGGTSYIRFAYSTNVSGGDVTRENIQLEDGTVATDYEPYEKYIIPIKVSGKNLLDMSGAKGGTNAGVTAVINADGTISTSGIADNITINIWLLGQYKTTKVLFNLPVGEYYASNCRVITYDGNTMKGVQGYFNVTKEEYPNGFPVTAIRFEQTTAGTDYNGKILYPMIESGSVKTDFEPYKEEIINIYIDEPLRKVGDYADYIDFKSKKLIRNVGVLTLTGEEVWWEKEGIYYLEDAIKVSSDKEISVSTHFTYEEEIGFWIDDKNRINIIQEEVGSLEEFKEWLRNNNVTIHYPLKKSIIEEIELPKININEKNSYISVDTSVKPSKILLEYD